MEIENIIDFNVNKFLNEQSYDKRTFYHGTPDVTEIEKEGGFQKRTTSVTYIDNPIELKKLESEMVDAMSSNDDELYHQLLDKIGNLKKTYNYNKPIFLSDKYSVAKSYANPNRAFDYESAREKVIEVNVNCNKRLVVSAFSQRFRFLSINSVKKGFIEAGVSEQKIDNLISMFTFQVKDNKGMRTDVIGAIAHWLGFDCVDVVGVLDSYDGGRETSTVRMVFDPQNIKIIN